MKKSKFSLLLATSLATSVFLAACGSDSSDDSSSKSGSSSATQELRVLESAEIPSMDSVMAEDTVSFTMLNNVNEGLYRQDQDNNLVAGVADGEPEVNENGTEFTVKIKEGLKWSNGTELTANDFVYAWQRAIDPENASPYGAYMMNGKIVGATEITDAAAAGQAYDVTTLGITAKDDHTLVIQTEIPMTNEFFKGLMAFGTFYPQNEAFVEEQGDKYATSADTVLYNGPFVMSDWSGSTDSEWIMEKNEDYWNAEEVSLEKVTFNVSKDPQAAVNAFEAGEVDVTGKLSSDIVPQYEGDERMVSWLDPSIFWLKFNEDNEILANENIRRALAMSFNKEDLVTDILANGSVEANYVVPKDFVKDEDGKDFREANGDLLTYDLDAAKEYWAKGLEELGLKEVTLSILGGDTESAKKIDQYVQHQWETNLEGLKVELESVPFSIRLDRQTSQDFDILDSGWGPDYLDPMTFSDLWVTGGSNNNMSYSNAEYDALIEKAQQTADLAEKWSLLADAEKIVLEEDAALAPMYQRASNVLVAENVEGFTYHLVGAEYSYQYITITE
ncbi:peptide ABC transporter substrate-binding protein [Bacillus sp. AGMB 02131]|uniref:Peptide ABC transporter substrate-binding protein n=1 Tax=Peribacillus faecalis TaxID=2772559 RepID=A0A927D2G4_9BACI|nr:peptide ABC transporter substrate-binding protein [Peribacillus faecalis]MBD3110340.1 peptide ABC transporter substrate-binding protein [Peribacillus faecalis]